MPAILRTTQQNKAQLVAELRGQGKIELSSVFGTERDLGVSLIFYVSDSKTARSVAAALTAEGIPPPFKFMMKVPTISISISTGSFCLKKQDPWGGGLSLGFSALYR